MSGTDEHQGEHQDEEARRARMLAGLRTGRGAPELARLSHQGRRWMERSLAPSCDACIARATCDAFEAGATCAIAEAHQEALLEAVRPEVDTTPALEPLVREYCKLVVGIGIIDTYIAHGSPFLPGAPAYLEEQPVFGLRLRMSGRMEALADKLGLTPAAKHRMRQQQAVDAGAVWAAAVAAAAEPVREGEFEPVTAEPEGVGIDGPDAGDGTGGEPGPGTGGD